LTSNTVIDLNEAGVRASNQLAPPPAKLRRSLGKHLAQMAADQPPTPDPAALLLPIGAWYVAIVGTGATREGNRRHPLQDVAEAKAWMERR